MAAKKKAAAKIPTYDELPELVTIEEAASFLRTSRNGTYSLVQSKHLPCVRFGRLIRIRKIVLIGEGDHG
ncbi:MAG: helix-turn-helix domain-containing protein [Acidobacteria bacterium]|nr:helix-turn-helix domain-containing protein [Acidobacteriota bacterium]